ncbi:hypothetical protein JW851_02620 [Candidatus Woesearchaeota archaeon]|nr:hypothetical protein [Candidatus Woesearchaeota archaeon]
MAVKDVKFPDIFVKHKGNFDFDKVCQDIKSWYDEEGYEFHATKHKHKPAEEELKFHGERKITGYVKFYIYLLIRIRELKTVEIIKEGKKIEINNGLIAFNITPAYKLDYENRFGGNKWLIALQDIYHKYIIKRKLEDYWEDELYFQANDLIRAIKTSLEYEAM